MLYRVLNFKTLNLSNSPMRHAPAKSQSKSNPPQITITTKPKTSTTIREIL
jgi:hypothetical protein